MSEAQQKSDLTTKIILSDENYYTNEADWQYMSVSQFKNFQKCEAAALAKLKGDWEPSSDPIALLVGNYVHSYFESDEAHEKFKEENFSKMYSSRKPYGLKKDFKVAVEMIEALEYDEFFNMIYQGKKEVIVTGDLFGATWKAKIDCLNLKDSYFVDLKTTRELAMRYWSKKYNSYVSFVEEFGYIMQMGVYKLLLEQKYDDEINPFIFAVTKQDPPDIAAITINPDRYEFEYSIIEKELPRILEVKQGITEPARCEHCEYCRKTKKITGFIEVDDLIERKY